VPIHLRGESHWVLAVVSLQDINISLYDSWSPTQEKNSQVQDWKKASGAKIISVSNISLI